MSGPAAARTKSDPQGSSGPPNSIVSTTHPNPQGVGWPVGELRVLRAARLIVSTTQRVSLACVAAEVDVSPSYLESLFRRELQASVAQFGVWARLHRAAILLGVSSRSMSVKRAHLECGFSDVANLSRHFKQHFGLAPSRFRSRLVRHVPESEATAGGCRCSPPARMLILTLLLPSLGGAEGLW